jgi:N-acetyl-anhydromuramyl-L-alanine amidase AmpD
LGDGSIEAVNNYHITPGSNNHLSPNGAPKFAYHYGITKKGEVWQANMLSDVTWHCKTQNTASIGIMVVGDFNGPNHTGTAKKPAKKQLRALENLLNHLVNSAKLNLECVSIYGHSSFGKQNCPGTALENFIIKYRR